MILQRIHERLHHTRRIFRVHKLEGVLSAVIFFTPAEHGFNRAAFKSNGAVRIEDRDEIPANTP